MKLFKFDPEVLDYKRVSLLKITLLFLLFTVLIASLSSFMVYKSDIRYVMSEREVNLVTNTSFTKEALINKIKSMKFKYPDIVLAQAIIESSHFKSPVFLENNNCFGMRQARQRYTLANGSNLNHATYDNWLLSVDDRMIYEALYLHKLDRESYKKYLDASYAEGSNYTNKLEMIIKTSNLKQYFE